MQLKARHTVAAFRNFVVPATNKTHPTAPRKSNHALMYLGCFLYIAIQLKAVVRLDLHLPGPSAEEGIVRLLD